ncbi:MAG: TIGR01777 family protein [Actinobacteria bacterium]|nr:TIGR01777 family protein [Actinomycetota bacterium]
MAGRKILVSGASGFIGIPLCAALRLRGDEVIELTRGESAEGRVHWDPAAGELDPQALAGVDAMVHLAGEPIAGLWTNAKKRRIIESRRAGTTLLAEAAAQLRPSVFVSSSAIGFYGDRGDDVITEADGNGEGFLAEVVRVWEDSAEPARDAGIRTVALRIGLVLGRGGGMLGPLKPLFKFGGGGRIGSGRQWWSWVALEDVVRAFLQAIDNERLSGPYNVAAPEPVTNAEFTKVFAKSVRRPAFVPAPAFAMRLAMRDMADEMLLASQRVDSARLRETGFEFEYTDLARALEDSL